MHIVKYQWRADLLLSKNIEIRIRRIYRIRLFIMSMLTALLNVRSIWSSRYRLDVVYVIQAISLKSSFFVFTSVSYVTTPV